MLDLNRELSHLTVEQLNELTYELQARRMDYLSSKEGKAHSVRTAAGHVLDALANEKGLSDYTSDRRYFLRECVCRFDGLIPGRESPNDPKWRGPHHSAKDCDSRCPEHKSAA
jgi:hypothetical protein